MIISDLKGFVWNEEKTNSEICDQGTPKTEGKLSWSLNYFYLLKISGKTNLNIVYALVGHPFVCCETQVEFKPGIHSSVNFAGLVS